MNENMPEISNIILQFKSNETTRMVISNRSKKDTATKYENK